jgi:hypothetical protein
MPLTVLGRIICAGWLDNDQAGQLVLCRPGQDRTRRNVVGEFELRQATPADAAAIRRLTRAAYAKWIPASGREPKPMTVDYSVAPLA